MSTGVEDNPRVQHVDKIDKIAGADQTPRVLVQEEEDQGQTPGIGETIETQEGAIIVDSRGILPGSAEPLRGKQQERSSRVVQRNLMERMRRCCALKSAAQVTVMRQQPQPGV